MNFELSTTQRFGKTARHAFEHYRRSYFQTCVLSVILGIIYTMVGLIFSYFEDVRPGGAIVVAAVIGIVIFLIVSSIKNRLKPTEERGMSNAAAASAQ